MSEERAALRARLLFERDAFVNALPASVRNLAFRVLPSPVLARIAPGARIAAYCAMGTEPPTQALMEYLDERGFRLCLPRLGKTIREDMEFADWAPGDPLVPGKLRIPQPDPAAPVVVPDVILAPMVGFDRKLDRIGHGAGYYDRYFAAQPDALRIGMAWSCQMVEALPVEPWDMPLHLVITEQAIHERVAA